MKNLKQILAVVLIASMFTATAPQKANAGVGIVVAIFSGVPGLVLMGVGGASAAVGYVAADGHCDEDGWTCGARFVGGLPLLGAGIVLLDDDSHTLQFGVIASADAQKIGMSEAELAAYNSELDEINAVRTQIGAELAREEKPSIEQSRELWNKYSQELSPEAFAGVQKISQTFLRQ